MWSRISIKSGSNSNKLHFWLILTQPVHQGWIQEHLFDMCFRLCIDNENITQTCGFASEQDATSSDLDLWMPQTRDAPMAVDTAKYIVGHVGAGFCELIEQEKSAMSWMGPDGMLAYLWQFYTLYLRTPKKTWTCELRKFE